MADNATQAYKDLTKVIGDLTKQMSNWEGQARKNAEIQKILLESASKLNAAYSNASGIKDLSTTQQELKRNTEALSKAQQNAKIISDEELKAKLKLQEAEKLRKQALRAEIQAENASVGSKQKLRAENKLLRQETDKLNLSTKQGQERLKELNKQIDANDKAIKKNSDSLTKQKINIGNYSSALGGLGGALGSATNGIISMTRAAIAFIATPFGAILGAIVLALKAVTTYFRTSEEGQNAWNKAIKVGSVILGNLSDIVSEVGKALFEAFTNPQEAVKNLWEAIKTNIVNRFDGLINQFKAFGKIVEAAIDLDWDTVKEGSKEFADATIQAFTGVEDAIGKTTRAVTGLIEETEREIEVAKRLADIEADRDLKQRALIVDQEKLRAESRELRLKAEQAEGEERIRLLREAFSVEDELARRRNEIAEINLMLKRESNKLSNSTKEDLDEEARLEAELFVIQQDRLKLQRTLQTQINTERNKINAQRKAESKALSDAILADEEALAKEVDALEEAELQKYFEREDKKTEKTKEELDKREEAQKSFSQSIESTANEFLQRGLDSRVNAIDAEIAAEQAALAQKLENENLDEEQRAELEKKSEAKQKQLRIKRAKAERQNSLFEIAIDTAKGIAKAVAASPLTFGLPFSAFVAGQGALQAALVASQPLPQFDKGTNYFPGLGEVAEKRPEFVKNNGNWELFTQPTILGKDYKGAEVLSGAESGRIIDNIIRGDVINNIAQSKDNREQFMIAKAIDEAMGRHMSKQTNALISGLKQSQKPTDYRYGRSRDKFGA